MKMLPPMPACAACGPVSRYPGSHVKTEDFDELRNGIIDLAVERSAGKLGPDALGLALAVHHRPLRGSGCGPLSDIGFFGYRDDVPVYPASVMKLFCLYAFTAFEAMGRFQPDDEDRRAARAMIELSSNEATAFLMGRLTDAFDGPCLTTAGLSNWLRDRHAVQHWLMSLKRPEFAGINVLHATYEDSPYGCAHQARSVSMGNRLSARACAALMHDIVRGAADTSDWMMELMDRSRERLTFALTGIAPEGDQVRGFLGEGMPETTHLWSKAGHTSWTRHDLVYAETASGPSFIACLMTDSRWSADDRDFFPEVGRRIHAAALKGG